MKKLTFLLTLLMMTMIFAAAKPALAAVECALDGDCDEKVIGGQYCTICTAVPDGGSKNKYPGKSCTRDNTTKDQAARKKAASGMALAQCRNGENPKTPKCLKVPERPGMSTGTNGAGATGATVGQPQSGTMDHMDGNCAEPAYMYNGIEYNNGIQINE